MSDVKLAAIVFDCADAATLASFWSRVLDRPVDNGASDGFAAITGAPTFMFFQVPEAKQTKNRLHVDLSTEDLEAAVSRIVGLGASRLADHEEYGIRWVTLADPEGNEFDVARH